MGVLVLLFDKKRDNSIHFVEVCRNGLIGFRLSNQWMVVVLALYSHVPTRNKKNYKGLRLFAAKNYKQSGC